MGGKGPEAEQSRSMSSLAKLLKSSDESDAAGKAAPPGKAAGAGAPGSAVEGEEVGWRRPGWVFDRRMGGSRMRG